jgi:hypothetical protein
MYVPFVLLGCVYTLLPFMSAVTRICIFIALKYVSRISVMMLVAQITSELPALQQKNNNFLNKQRKFFRFPRWFLINWW